MSRSSRPSRPPREVADEVRRRPAPSLRRRRSRDRPHGVRRRRSRPRARSGRRRCARPSTGATITRLDTSRAERHPGVHAVVTHADVPKNVYGHLEALGVPADEPLLAVDDVRWKGQLIAVVAAEDEATALEAVELIELEFEEKEPLLDIRKAFDPDAPQIHQWGNWYPFFGGPDAGPGPPADPQGRRRAGVREGRRDRPGRLPARRRSSTCRSRRRSRSPSPRRAAG